MLTLSQVLQRGLSDLGRTDTFTATAGSTTTADRGDFSTLPQPPIDDYATNFSLFVQKSTDGLAPQGEFGRVISYDSGNSRYTIATALSATIGVGDEIVIADSLFPLQEMIQRVNRALEKLGEIIVVDNTITTAANQREYTLPVTIVRRPLAVKIQTNTTDADDPRYVSVYDWDVVPGAVGSTGLLVFDHQPVASRKLKIWYGGLHSALTVYSSQISETIHPQVSIAAFTEAALEWFVGRVSGSRANAFWISRWNDAKRNLLNALLAHPIPKPDTQDKYLTFDNEIDGDTGYYVV